MITWTSIKDEMPKHGDDVIVVSYHGAHYRGGFHLAGEDSYLMCEMGYEVKLYEITHWVRLTLPETK